MISIKRSLAGEPSTMMDDLYMEIWVIVNHGFNHGFKHQQKMVHKMDDHGKKSGIIWESIFFTSVNLSLEAWNPGRRLRLLLLASLTSPKGRETNGKNDATNHPYMGRVQGYPFNIV